MVPGRGKKSTIKGCCGLKKEPLLQVIPSLCSLEGKSQCLCFVAQISQANLPASHQQEKESAYVCVSSAGWASCPISVRPDMIRRQIVSSPSLWPLAFLLRGEKGSKRWHSATLPLIPRHHKDTDPLETSLNKSTSCNSDIGLYYIEREKGGVEVKWALTALLCYGNPHKGSWRREEDALCGLLEVRRNVCRLFCKVNSIAFWKCPYKISF